MPGTSYQIITAAEKQTLEDNFSNFVGANTNLYSAFDVSVSGGSYFGGYKVGFNDYVGIVSHVGVQQWLVRFGYSNDGLSQPGFCIILSGIDALGVSITPHYRLIDPFNDITWQYNTMVPNTMANQWENSWKNLNNINVHNIPQSYCQMPSPYGSLRGYNFDVSDFLNLLDENPHENTADLEIYFTMVDHAEEAETPIEQPNLPGKLGIMVALGQPMGNQNGNISTLISSFYDISAPCPPTCPGV